jgi:ribulose-phosphate 3-epimerase
MTIIPTIFDKDYREAERKLEMVKGLVKWVQFDVTDNVFTPGKTFELELLGKFGIEMTDFLYDIHLMVKEPIKWLEKCLFVNASRVIGQVEMMDNIDSFVKRSKDVGFETGIAYDWGTGIGRIPKEVDLVLLMGRKAGFANSALEKGVVEKIEKLIKIRESDSLEFRIGIDGGVKLENIRELKIRGVDFVYCGGAVFNGNVKNNLELLQKKAQDDREN